MKTETLYKQPTGNLWKTETPEGIPTKVIFIRSFSVGDWNIKTYAKTKKKSSRSSTVTHLYFEPTREGWEADYKRGMTFFSIKDGILFGAYHEMTKYGVFHNIQA